MTNITPGQLRITIDETKVAWGNWVTPKRVLRVKPGIILHVIEERERTPFGHAQPWWIVFMDGEGPFWMRSHWFDNVTRIM